MVSIHHVIDHIQVSIYALAAPQRIKTSASPKQPDIKCTMSNQSPISIMYYVRFFFLYSVLSLSFPAIEASPLTSSTIHRFTIGQINATILFDGPTVFDQNPFLVSDRLVEESYKDCFRQTNPILASQNIIVLDTPTSRVLVDAGARGVQNVPFFARSGLLFQRLTEANIHPHSIQAVLITHAHADHVSGLRNPNGTAAFPNAHVYISKEEHRFWIADPLPVPETAPLPDTLITFAQIYRESIRPYQTRLHLVPRYGRPLPGFRFLPTSGHSPGHSSIQVKFGSHRLVIIGDAWIAKPDQLQNPTWGVGTATNPRVALISRLRLLWLVSRRNDLVMAFHEQFPGIGYVSKNGASFNWTPALTSVQH